jgi:hypothetical protein
MRPLFEAIKQAAGLPAKNKINIEGAAFSDDKAFLLHRGNVSGNFIIEMDKASLIAFIKNETNTLPALKVYFFDLPKDKGVSAGFSGACILPEYSGLLFLASLENTDNAIDDGAVLGSYLGFISFEKMKEGKFVAGLISEHGSPLQKKQEGISIKSIKDNKITVLSVCDNDDGSSDLYEIEVKINQE